MPMTNHDRHMLSTFRGAPIMTPTAGTLIAVLDAFLLTGYGHITAQSAVIAGGICTATVNAGENFDVDACILISNATPVDLNGVARVTANSATTVSWPTSLPDGPVTGPVGIRYAPAPGPWEKVFSKTNVAVYRSTHPESSGMCLRVDDTGTNQASVRAYKTMSDVDTGTDPFPTTARLANPIWQKAYSGTAAKSYLLWADRSMLIAGLEGGSSVNFSCNAFGDPIVVNPAGDVFSCLLSAQSIISDNGIRSGAVASATGAGIFSCRTAAGAVNANMGAIALMGASAVSGADGSFGPYNAALDGKLIFSELALIEGATSGPPRAILPSLRHVPQSGLSTPTLGSKIQLDSGGKVLAVPCSSSLGAGRSGTYFLEIGVGRP